ncbi:tyrosine-type recombinase/integrase [Chloroflexota bacterium]
MPPLRTARQDGLPEPHDLKYLDESQVDRLLSACTNFRDYLLIRTLWKTGCRVSEVLSLTNDGIDLKRGTITVPALKLKRKGRMKFPVVDAETLSMLANYAKRKSARIFPITRVRAFQIVQDAGKRVGLNVSPHMLRHSFAVKWAKEGGDLVKLQRQLGHSRLATTTDMYLHFSTADIAREYDQVWRGG